MRKAINQMIHPKVQSFIRVIIENSPETSCPFTLVLHALPERLPVSKYLERSKYCPPLLLSGSHATGMRNTVPLTLA